MEELYEMIEERIVKSGYPGQIDPEEFYDDISAEAEDQEEGSYVFVIKKEENLIYQGCMTIMDDQFDLHYVDIVAGSKTYHVDFD